VPLKLIQNGTILLTLVFEVAMAQRVLLDQFLLQAVAAVVVTAV
jgi:hypothetical protein